MNSVILIGNLARDPELRYSTGMNQTAVCNLVVAVNDGFGERQQTNFIPVVVFGKTAENCDRYLSKGKKVAIQGRIQVRNYTNKEGNKVYVTEVVANTYGGVEFLSPKGESGQGGFSGGYHQGGQSGFNQGGYNQGGGYGGQQQGFDGGFGGQQNAGFDQSSDSFGGPEQPMQQAPAPQQDASQGIPEGFQALQDDDIPF